MSIIRQILQDNSLSSYKAGQAIADQTGQSQNAVRVRLDKWAQEMPKSWRMIEEYLAALGYEIIVKRKN